MGKLHREGINRNPVSSLCFHTIINGDIKGHKGHSMLLPLQPARPGLRVNVFIPNAHTGRQSKKCTIIERGMGSLCVCLKNLKPINRMNGGMFTLEEEKGVDSNFVSSVFLYSAHN